MSNKLIRTYAIPGSYLRWLMQIIENLNQDNWSLSHRLETRTSQVQGDRLILIILISDIWSSEL
jgi:hypothetical protein